MNTDIAQLLDLVNYEAYIMNGGIGSPSRTFAAIDRWMSEHALSINMRLPFIYIVNDLSGLHRFKWNERVQFSLSGCYAVIIKMLLRERAS